MSDDRRAEPDEGAVDRIGRAAGAELRRPAPESGAAQAAAAGRRRRRVRHAALGAVPALVLVAAGSVIVLARRSGDAVQTPPPIGTAVAGSTEPLAPTPPSTIAAPVTFPATLPVEAVRPTTLPATTAPATVPASTAPTPDSAALLGDLPYESAGIPIAHADIRSGDDAYTRASEVEIGPTGLPVAYDPAARTLTRYVRDDGEYVSAVLPEEYGDPTIIAVGPDDVVYLNVTIEAGVEGSADIVAVALAPGDAGREIDRAVSRGNTGDDSDLVATPAGIVQIGWYDEGSRPPPDAELVMAWVDRDPTTTELPTEVPAITIDAYEHTVTVNATTWRLTGDAGAIQPVGMPAIVATFDGGFLARYDEYAGAQPHSTVVRGWADGSTEEWVLRSTAFESAAYPIPEPQGTVLVPDGDQFLRVAPFTEPDAAFAIEFELDGDTGTAMIGPGVNEYLDTTDSHLERDPAALAAAIVPPLNSPAELRTVSVGLGDGGDPAVVVTTERLLDDSIYGTRLVLPFETLADGTLRANPAAGWSQTCQAGRGHQDYRSELCT